MLERKKLSTKDEGETSEIDGEEKEGGLSSFLEETSSPNYTRMRTEMAGQRMKNPKIRSFLSQESTPFLPFFKLLSSLGFASFLGSSFSIPASLSFFKDF